MKVVDSKVLMQILSMKEALEHPCQIHPNNRDQDLGQSSMSQDKGWNTYDCIGKYMTKCQYPKWYMV